MCISQGGSIRLRGIPLSGVKFRVNYQEAAIERYIYYNSDLLCHIQLYISIINDCKGRYILCKQDEWHGGVTAGQWGKSARGRDSA